MDGIAFENVAAQSGVKYRWKLQPRPMRNVEAFGTGCAFLDYDNDGWQDILLIDEPTSVLFRNQRNGRFQNVSASTQLSSQRGAWKGCAVGDYDGDGFLDLLLTGYHCLALLKNDSGKRWLNRTEQVGLDNHDGGQWGSSAGFMDLDSNGTLDLLIGHYVVFGPREKQYCYDRKGVKIGCRPQAYRPEYVELWHNQGGRFKDVSATAGMKKTHGRALVVAFADVDDDGRFDFYVGNDGTPAELMLNQGNLRFRNIGASSGTAYGVAPGSIMAAMGADWSDYDGDGKLDLAVSGFSNESFSLQHNLGNGLFEQNSATTGIAAPTQKPLGFGTEWLDVDNDGWPDLVFVNGHVYDRAAEVEKATALRQPSMLFHNREGYLGERNFVDIAPKLGGDWIRPILGRGLAGGDFDNDGRMDALVVDYEGEPLLLRNISKTPSHWIKLDLRALGANPFAYGAKIVARGGKRQWVEQVSPASSYLSSSDPRVHLGLGDVTRLQSLSITWPDGKREVLRDVAVDRVLIVRQGAGASSK